jgi:hypothetical protein
MGWFGKGSRIITVPTGEQQEKHCYRCVRTLVEYDAWTEEKTLAVVEFSGCFLFGSDSLTYEHKLVSGV